MQVKTVDITTSQPALSELLKLLEEDSEIILAAAGREVARLLPADAPPKRIAGLHEGQGWVSDDFDDPLPDEFWGGRV